VTCEQAREAISAELDGEASAGDLVALAEHLRGCAGCTEFRDRAMALHRRIRVLPAPVVRDVAGDIAARVRTDAANRRRMWWAWVLTRASLVAVGVAQVLLAAPTLLLGHDEQAPTHVAHEVGSFAVAVAVGLLLAAYRPRLSSGMLPIVGIIAGLLLLTAATDVALGRTQLAEEWPHLLDLAGFLLLWRLAKITTGPEADYSGWAYAPTVHAEDNAAA
jgi:predicted anti-sigma-YlaC factor YlaD